jgi:hypothetical protein
MKPHRPQRESKPRGPKPKKEPPNAPTRIGRWKTLITSVDDVILLGIEEAPWDRNWHIPVTLRFVQTNRTPSNEEFGFILEAARPIVNAYSVLRHGRPVADFYNRYSGEPVLKVHKNSVVAHCIARHVPSGNLNNLEVDYRLIVTMRRRSPGEKDPI